MREVIHVMRVLHWLGEYWRVREFGGDYGATDRSVKLWECDEELLWLPKMESVELDEEEMAPVVRSHKTNNGIKRKRYHSVGEDQVCVKKRRTNECVVCLK